MVSGGSGACRSRDRRDAMPNPVSRTCPSAQSHHNVSWLDVFVDEPALMKLAQSRGNSDSQAQEASYLHGLTEQTVERLAAQIIEHQHGPTGVAHEGQRPRRPCPVELIFQLVFVREAIES